MAAEWHDSAFPTPPVYSGGEQAYGGYSGVTILEWYAGQALVGLLSGGCAPNNAPDTAFDIAEAMIAESNKRVDKLRKTFEKGE